MAFSPEDAPRDGNFVTAALFQIDGAARGQLLAGQIDQSSGRILVDSAGGGGTGTVTSVSVATANGFAGTVANPTTTPAITLSTTVTGLIKGNGAAISAAIADTDYQAPITLTTTGSTGPATFLADTLNIPDYSSSTGTFANTALSNLASVAINTTLLPGANDGAALGNGSFSFSDLFLASGGVMNWNNGVVTITEGTGTLAFNGSSGVASTFTSSTGGTAISAAGVTSGVGIQANSVTTGTGMQATAVTTGTAFNAATTTTGVGFKYSNTNAGATTATGFYATGSATMTSDFTGVAGYNLDMTKTMTAAATRVVSGNMVKINPTYSITGTSASVYTLSGDTTAFARTLTNSSSSGTSGLTVTGALVSMTNNLGTATNAVTDSSNVLKVNQAYSSASGDVLSILNSGTGAYINAGSTAFVVSKAGHITLEGVTSTGATGTGKFVFDTSPTLVTPTLGVATATSINKVAITQPATGSTLTIADGKTLTIDRSLEFTGTDGTIMTFPGSNQTIVGLTTTQTLTNKFVTPQVQAVTSSATVTPVSITNDMVVITAQAAGLTLAVPSGSPVQGEKLVIRIKDNGTAQTITWNAIYRASSDLALPTTTILSKTMYCGFIFNSTDTKWDFVAFLNNF